MLDHEDPSFSLYRPFLTEPVRGEPGCAGWGCRKCGRISPHRTSYCPACRSSTCVETACEGCGAARAEGVTFACPEDLTTFAIKTEAEEESAGAVIDAYCSEVESQWPARKGVYGDELDDPDERAVEAAEVFAPLAQTSRLARYDRLPTPESYLDRLAAEATARSAGCTPSEPVTAEPAIAPPARAGRWRKLLVQTLKSAIAILEDP